MGKRILVGKMRKPQSLTELAAMLKACLRCGHCWYIRRPRDPEKCPRCKSKFWNRPRKVKANG